MENDRETDAFDARAGRPNPRDPASVAEARTLLLDPSSLAGTEAGRVFQEACDLLLEIDARYAGTSRNTNVLPSPAAALLRRLDLVKTRPSTDPKSPRRYRPTPSGEEFAGRIRHELRKEDRP